MKYVRKLGWSDTLIEGFQMWDSSTLEYREPKTIEERLDLFEEVLLDLANRMQSVEADQGDAARAIMRLEDQSE